MLLIYVIHSFPPFFPKIKMSKRHREESAEEVARAVQLIRGSSFTSTISSSCEAKNGSSVTLTRLEKQVASLKEAIPSHVILMVACGYRVKLYGRDSCVVSRRTGIMCIPSSLCEYSSFPYARVGVYVHRLVQMGYHVAFADQESAALRAAEEKSGIFSRSISRWYSRGTLLPGEQVQTIGELAAEACSKEVEGEELAEGTVEDYSSPTLTYNSHPSELMLMFISCSTHTAAEQTISLVLVSFVTYQRLFFTFSTQKDSVLEDVLHRYEICEVIVLPDASGNACGQHSSSHCQTNAAHFLKTQLPPNIYSLLTHMLALQLGPSTTGEEDSGSVSITFFGWENVKGLSLDEQIEAYLKPYQLDAVYNRMARRGSEFEVPLLGGEVLQEVPGDASKIQPIKKPGAKKMELPGSALSALEVFRSSYGTNHSLFQFLNFTKTAPGARKLREWLANPLVSYREVMDRQQAVTFLVQENRGESLERFLREVGRGGDSDLEVVLSRIQARQCPVKSFVTLVRVLASLIRQGGEQEAAGSSSIPPFILERMCLLNAVGVRKFVEQYAILERPGITTTLDIFSKGYLPWPESVDVEEPVSCAEAAEKSLEEELEAVRKQTGMKDLEYRSIAGTSYIIDLPHSKTDIAGSDWVVLSRTKTNVRYHTPRIVHATVKLNAARQIIAGASRVAWDSFQENLIRENDELAALQSAVAALSELDAVYSLGVASRREGYVAPVITSLEASPNGEEAIMIRKGRHPVAEVALKHQYVACDAQLVRGGSLLLTGPNMGGKSAFMRMIGVFSLLAQIGCHVPAEHATLPIFTGLYARMGASDSIFAGNSTFMSEMDETSRILSQPMLHHSLVLMDELGRGTSSFDGMAIAAATLEYLIERRATSIFVTHYTNLCEPYCHPDGSAAPWGKTNRVQCYFMGFREERDLSGPLLSAAEEETKNEAEKADARVVFTYQLMRGVAPSSFGVQVARMAGLPKRVTNDAKHQSHKLEELYYLSRDVSHLSQIVGAQ